MLSMLLLAITSPSCSALLPPLPLQGMKVAVIEGHDIGGTCVNRGCVPSKALLAAAGRVRDFKNQQHLKAMGIQVGERAGQFGTIQSVT